MLDCFRYENFWTGARHKASLKSKHQFSLDLMLPRRFCCGLRLNAELMFR